MQLIDLPIFIPETRTGIGFERNIFLTVLTLVYPYLPTFIPLTFPPMPKKKDFSFFLKDATMNEPTLILFRMPVPGEPKPLKRSIGKFIHPDHWDLKEQRPHPTKDKTIKEIDQLIQAITDVIPVVKADCKRKNRVISKDDINAALDVILQDKRSDKEKAPLRDMFSDFKVIIASMKDGSILTPGKNKKRYAQETIKSYEIRTLPKLEDFYKDKKELAQWAGVDLELYELFVSWCHEKDLSNNSIGVFIKCWKRAGKIALKKGWHSNTVFADEEFMILKEETPDIYLDESKIELIYNQTVSIEHYDIARDWFVLDCLLGLRISDLRRIGKKDFDGKHFQFVNQKTGAHVAIPIHRHVKSIIKKWKGLPPAITDQKLNLYIKEVAKLAKINDKFIYKITKGGKLQVFEYQEWQMVSSHTCRRSFITNLLKMGVPHAQVMKLAGITRYETLMRYFKQTAEEAANDVGKHDYFQ